MRTDKRSTSGGDVPAKPPRKAMNDGETVLSRFVILRQMAGKRKEERHSHEPERKKPCECC